jgi:hypothetical protein
LTLSATESDSRFFSSLQLKATGTDWVLTGIIFGEIPIDAEGLFEDYGIEGAFSTQ